MKQCTDITCTSIPSSDEKKKFCYKCGKLLVHFPKCSACGKELHRVDKFCPYCGKEVGL